MGTKKIEYQRRRLQIVVIVLTVILALLLIALWVLSSSGDDPLLQSGGIAPPGTSADHDDTSQEQMQQQQQQGSASSGEDTPSPPPDVTQTPPEQIVDVPVPSTKPDLSQSVPVPSNPSGTGDTEALTCAQFAIFSGQFVEDARDELVENVAAVLVTNNTGRFLDLANLTYNIEGTEATFIVTGLPAGRSAWVLEANKLTIAQGADPEYVGCVTSFRDGVTASTDKLTITAEGNILTAVNNTGETLKGVFVYYKRVHTDGNFYGGITYAVEFGDIEPGQSAQTLAGHYKPGETEFVRVGWQE